MIEKFDTSHDQWKLLKVFQVPWVEYWILGIKAHALFVALDKGNIILIVMSSKLEAVAVKSSAFRSLARRALNNEAS